MAAKRPSKEGGGEPEPKRAPGNDTAAGEGSQVRDRTRENKETKEEGRRPALSPSFPLPFLSLHTHKHTHTHIYTCT